MELIVYGLCVITSALCAVLLLRAYARTRYKLLLWSGLCFIGLTLNNLLVFIDVNIVRQTDLSVWRTVPALAGVALLLYGMIWETR